MKKKTRTLVVYGKLQNDRDTWSEWLTFAKSIVAKHKNDVWIGVGGEGFGNKIVKFSKKYETRVINAINREKTIEFIELYSLPDPFNSAFDSDIYISRVKHEIVLFVEVTIDKKVYKKLGYSYVDLLSEMKKYIFPESAVFFEMDIDELPLKYIMSKGNDLDFKSLKILYKE